MSYASHLGADARLGEGVGAPRTPPPSTPLTDEVLNVIASATAMAEEIEKRLFGLRDRLFGSPAEPPEPPNGANQLQPGHFRGVFAGRSASLIDTLNTIDRISMDLANRL